MGQIPPSFHYVFSHIYLPQNYSLCERSAAEEEK